MAKLTKKWTTLLRRIPGYNPIATAGDCTFDVEAAQRALDFFPEILTHVKGDLAEQPFNLRPWQRAIVANAFGWIRPDGSRRYREVFLYVPRKNGKTTLGAGLINYLTFCDGEPGAENYSAAADRDQAALVWSQAAGMIRQQPRLKSRCVVYRASKSIVLTNQQATYKVLSAEAYTKHGFNVHGCIIDELHTQPNRELVDVLLTGTGSRRQPLTFYLTTADFDRESICNEKLGYAERVRDGVIDDPTFLPVIYAATLDDDWHSEKVWRQANPNLGISVRADYLRAEHRKACEIPAYENTFKRLHLNIKTEQATRWITLETWDACSDDVPDAELVGAECFAGLDLASIRDVAALARWYPDTGTVRMNFWVPGDQARERQLRDRVPYDTWAEQGLIRRTPGNVIDYDVIRADINALAEQCQIKEIAIDRWNSTQLTTQLQGDGFEMVPFGQGFASMSGPTKELEKLILAKTIRHGGNLVLRWMISNIAVTTDAAGNIKPDKKRSSEKIDGPVALIMAIGRAIAQPSDDTVSVYDDRGLVTL